MSPAELVEAREHRSAVIIVALTSIALAARNMSGTVLALAPTLSAKISHTLSVGTALIADGAGWSKPLHLERRGVVSGLDRKAIRLRAVVLILNDPIDGRSCAHTGDDKL